jgi:hypothetical protein
MDAGFGGRRWQSLEEGDYGESMVAAVRNVGAITKAKKG